MPEKFTHFDAAEFLYNEEDIATFLADATDSGDPTVIVAALGAVARARNMAKLARDTGLSREGLYKAFRAEGNPSFETVAKVAAALGLKIEFRAAEPVSA